MGSINGEKVRKTKEVRVGGLSLGGGAPVAIQSMTNTDTRDVEATVRQVRQMEEAGCELVRVAVVDREAAGALGKIKGQINIPLVADIHFNYRLALEALEQGVDKIRINPGNIGSRDRVAAVVEAARQRGVPLRVGVNSGSLEGGLREKYGGPTAEALVESALGQVRLLEEMGFTDIVISLKASEVPLMIKAYRLISQKVNYPLHLGVTEAGTFLPSAVKSSLGIGSLLLEGIGDTLRVSLTGDPVKEMAVAREILRASGTRHLGPEIISCPTCGRCEIDLVSLAEEVEKGLASRKEPLKVAVMGCAVNGPGEAREADIGIAGGKGSGLLFVRGKVVARVPEGRLLEKLLEAIEQRGYIT